MNDHLSPLLQKHHQREVLVDTNLLLLWLVGSLDPAQITRFKRTKGRFVTEDFVTLQRLLQNFRQIVTTPNILTEVSNLAGHLNEPLKKKGLALLARQITLCEETFLPSKMAAAHQTFAKLGLTDAGIVSLAEEKGWLVLTNDFPLAGHLHQRGLAVINFNHVRPLNW